MDARLSGSRPVDALAFGRFEWRPTQRLLLVDRTAAPLGSRALDLLDTLIQRRARIVTKDELLDVVWPGLVVEEANLHVQVSALRKVLGSGVIATIPGRGYRFVAPLDGDSVNPVSSTPVQTAAFPVPALPPPPEPLIGREDDQRALLALVAERPLVTVAGPGGIGKTRLALATAHAYAGGEAGAAAWVPAAALAGDMALVTAAAQALHVALPRAGDAATLGVALAAALASRTQLLVLDNCEHLLDATAQLAATLRAGAPGVRVLVTSQEALNVRDEVVLRLAPLAVPPPNAPADERFGAVALFVQRARAADSRFVLDAGNAAAVAQICRSLDGLPLALELAAARVRLLGVHGLRDRLDQRLHLLGGGPRHALERHQTLRAALEWSHALLEPAEQRVLRRLGVFVGGFTLELAQQVCRDTAEGPDALDAWAVVDVLAALVDKSLVVADGDAPVRYRLLETMRLFALEQLTEHGELAALRTRHAEAVTAFFVDLDERGMGSTGTLDAAGALALAAPEVDNARAALSWVSTEGGEGYDAPLAIALSGTAAVAMSSAGVVRELLSTMLRLLPDLDRATPSAQVTLLWRLGFFGREIMLSHDELRRLKEDAVRRARSFGMRRRLYFTLATLGTTVASQSDFAAAQAIVDEMRTLEAGGIDSFVLPRLGVEIKILEMQGRLEEVVAKMHEQRALLLGQPGQTLNVAISEANLTLHFNALGHYEDTVVMARSLLSRDTRPDLQAKALFNMVLALARLGREDQALAAVCERRALLERCNVVIDGAAPLAELALARGHLADAVRLCAAFNAGFERRRETPHAIEREVADRVERACEAAGVTAVERALWRREGEALDNAALLRLALDDRPRELV